MTYSSGISDPTSSVMGTNPVLATLENSTHANKILTPVRTYMQNLDQWSGYTAGISPTEKALHDSGHKVFTSVRPKKGDGTVIPMTDIKNGLWDTQITAGFTNMYNGLTWGTGGRPTEILFCFNHEIGSGDSLAGQSATDIANFNAAYARIRSIHDTVQASLSPATRRVKFAVIYTLFNISQGACDKFVPVSTAWDFLGCDFYNQAGYNNSPTGTYKATSWKEASELFATPVAGQKITVLDWLVAKSIGRQWCVPEYNTVNNPSDATAGATWMTNADAFFKAQNIAFACYWLNNSGASRADWWADYPLQSQLATTTAGYKKYAAWLASVTSATTDTLAPAAPTIAAGQPTGVTNSAASITVNIPTTNSDSTTLTDLSYVQMYRDGAASTKSPTGLTPGATYTFTPSGNTPGSSHTYTFKAVDTTGNASVASSGVAVTFGSSGGTPPATPTGLSVSSIGRTTAQASCTPPSGPVTGYQWFVDGGAIAAATSAAPSALLTNLSSDTDHTVSVLAYNDAGASSQTSTVTFHTTANPDTTAPPAPGIPGLTNADPVTGVAIFWTAVTDTVVSGASTSGVANYQVLRSLGGSDPGTIIGNPTDPNFLDPTPPSSTFGPTIVYYSVAAIDRAGNLSAYGTALAVTVPTAATPTGPTAAEDIPDTVQEDQQFTADASGSFPGTAGPIASYIWDFGDRKGKVTTTNPITQYSYADFGIYTVILTVIDTLGNESVATDTVLASPSDGLTFPSGAPKVIPGNPTKAADVNNIADVYEQLFSTYGTSIDTLTAAINAGKTVTWRTGTETFTPSATLAEFQASDRRRMPMDLTGMGQFQIFAGVGTAGSVNAKVGCQFSTDAGTTWTNMDGSVGTALGAGAVSVAALGSFQGAWVSLPDAAKQDCLLRLVTGTGDGTTAAATFMIGIRVKP